MKRKLWMLCLAMFALQVKAADGPAEILERYLRLENSGDVLFGSTEAGRKTLEKLKATPEESVKEIKRRLPEIKSPLNRRELADCLHWFPTEESAALLAGFSNDTNAYVRRSAISSLGLLSRRVDRSGIQRIQRGGLFSPKVEGLTPLLIKATEDKDASNRELALFALADTLEPAAQEELRRRLKDKSAYVRLVAACLLTEFKDSSGLDEMKTALARIRATNAPREIQEDELRDWMIEDWGRLLASFERITGKSLGAIPPEIMWQRRTTDPLRQRLNELLDAWAAWWAWEPPK